MANRLTLICTLALAACDPVSTMQTKCQNNDSSVSPKSCYNAALDEGSVDGRTQGNVDGYDQGWSECEAGHSVDTGDSADTADTGA